MFGFKNRNSKEEKEHFQELIEPRLPVLYRIAYSYFKDKDSTSDAVQDAVLTAYKNFENLRDKDKFNSWLTTILVNRCRDILRKNKKVAFEEYNENVIDLTNAREVHSSSSKLEDKLDLLNVLHKLDDKYREVISLKYFGDYTIAEIAKVLDIPEGTVKSRLNFGIRKLKTLMEVKNDAM